MREGTPYRPVLRGKEGARVLGEWCGAGQGNGTWAKCVCWPAFLLCLRVCVCVHARVYLGACEWCWWL